MIAPYYKEMFKKNDEKNTVLILNKTIFSLS